MSGAFWSAASPRSGSPNLPRLLTLPRSDADAKVPKRHGRSVPESPEKPQVTMAEHPVPTGSRRYLRRARRSSPREYGHKIFKARTEKKSEGDPPRSSKRRSRVTGPVEVTPDSGQDFEDVLNDYYGSTTSRPHQMPLPDMYGREEFYQSRPSRYDRVRPPSRMHKFSPPPPMAPQYPMAPPPPPRISKYDNRHDANRRFLSKKLVGSHDRH